MEVVVLMLQTCSIHLNFDWGASDDVHVKRFVLANLLSPFAVGLFANSHILEGKATPYKSYRNYLWQNLDPLRTQRLPLKRIINNWSKAALVETYAHFAAQAPLIYLRRLPHKKIDSKLALNHWLQKPIMGLSPDEDDYRQHLSLLFPNVRPKGYLELRMVDAPPTAWQMIPALFFSGLMYSEKTMNKALKLLVPFSSNLSQLDKQALHGLDYNAVFTPAQKLITLSIEGLESLPQSFRNTSQIQQLINFAERYTFKQKVFADSHQF